MTLFSRDPDGQAHEVHLASRKLLEEVLDYLERLPTHPMTAQLAKRVRTHLDDPNVELVRRRDARIAADQQAQALALQASEGASRYTPAGKAVLMLRVVGSTAHISSPAAKAYGRTSAGRVLAEQIAKELAAGVSITLTRPGHLHGTAGEEVAVDATTPSLTAAQAAHVAGAFPETRDDMAKYLAERAEVVITKQHEAPELPPFAIAVAGADFWIDCCESQESAVARAIDLGLTVSQSA